jgi:hypothetical protein
MGWSTPKNSVSLVFNISPPSSGAADYQLAQSKTSGIGGRGNGCGNGLLPHLAAARMPSMRAARLLFVTGDGGVGHCARLLGDMAPCAGEEEERRG